MVIQALIERGVYRFLRFPPAGANIGLPLLKASCKERPAVRFSPAGGGELGLPAHQSNSGKKVWERRIAVPEHHS